MLVFIMGNLTVLSVFGGKTQYIVKWGTNCNIINNGLTIKCNVRGNPTVIIL